MSEESLRDTECALTKTELAVFVHELRNALTGIGGYGELLRRPLRQDERRAASDGIQLAVARADALCSVTLGGSLPAEETASSEPVQLRVLATRVASEQRVVTGRTIEVTGDDDVTVMGDELALARALTNLVDNAAKYSPADQPIGVSVSLEASADGSAVAVIEVSDRGPGILAEQRGRVFELFARLGRDAETPGTGLGLAVVRSVLEAHGGFVRVLDRIGGGAILRAELPAAQPTQRA